MAPKLVRVVVRGRWSSWNNILSQNNSVVANVRDQYTSIETDAVHKTKAAHVFVGRNAISNEICDYNIIYINWKKEMNIWFMKNEKGIINSGLSEPDAKESSSQFVEPSFRACLRP